MEYDGDEWAVDKLATTEVRPDKGNTVFTAAGKSVRNFRCTENVEKQLVGEGSEVAYVFLSRMKFKVNEDSLVRTNNLHTQTHG